MVVNADEELGSGRKSFDLLMNAAGELLIAFKATDEKLENPLFIYNGRFDGALYKSRQSSPISFSPLPREAFEALSRASEILCIEVANEHIVSQYLAKFEVKK